MVEVEKQAPRENVEGSKSSAKQVNVSALLLLELRALQPGSHPLVPL